MKYIRTKDGRIIDLEKFINKEKANPNYTSFRFNKIKKDGTLTWSAIGTSKCSNKDQIGRRCHFGGSFNCKIIKQADTIEDLCDEFVIVAKKDKNIKPYFTPYLTATLAVFDDVKSLLDTDDVYGAIWTIGEHGEPILKSVAKMNEKGDLCLS